MAEKPKLAWQRRLAAERRALKYAQREQARQNISLFNLDRGKLCEHGLTKCVKCGLNAVSALESEPPF